MIIGHHSHCLQGVEEYKDGVIFYSLGNFIFSGLKGKEIHGWPNFCNRGGMYKVYLTSEKKLNYKFIPFRVSNAGVDIHNTRKSEKNQNRLTKRLSQSDFMYKITYRYNVFVNWFFRIPLFLIKTKRGLISAMRSYMKIKYIRIFMSYFFSKK